MRRMIVLALAVVALAARADDSPGSRAFPRGKTPPSLIKAGCGKAGSGADQAELRAVWEIAKSGHFLVLGSEPADCDDTGCSREVTLGVAQVFRAPAQPTPDYVPSPKLLQLARKILASCPAVDWDTDTDSTGATHNEWALKDKAGTAVELIEVDALAGYSEEAEQCAAGPDGAQEPCKIHSEVGDFFLSATKDLKTVQVRYADDDAASVLLWNDEYGAYVDQDSAD